MKVAASRPPRCTDPGTDVCDREGGQIKQSNVKETIRFSPVPPTPGWWRPWRGACCCTTLGSCGRFSRRWRTERRNQPAAARYLSGRRQERFTVVLSTNSMTNSQQKYRRSTQLNSKKGEESAAFVGRIKASQFKGLFWHFLSFNVCLHCLLIIVLFWKKEIDSPQSSSLSGITNLLQCFREFQGKIQMFPLFTCRSICGDQINYVYFQIVVKNNRNQSKKQTNAFKKCSNSFSRCFKLMSERLYKVLYLKWNFN